MKDLFNHGLPVTKKPGINIANMSSQSIRTAQKPSVKAKDVEVVVEDVKEAVIVPEDIIEDVEVETE